MPDLVNWLSINGLEAFVGAVKRTYTPWAVCCCWAFSLPGVHLELSITFPKKFLQPRFVQMRLLGSLLAPSRLQCAHPAAKFQAVNDVDGNLQRPSVSRAQFTFIYVKPKCLHVGSGPPGGPWRRSRITSLRPTV
jgi:hypothetical protein